MGASTKHLQSLVPGVSHHIQSNGGQGRPMAESKSAKDVPHTPGGEARARGNRSEGARSNIAPSQTTDCPLSK